MALLVCIFVAVTVAAHLSLVESQKLQLLFLFSHAVVIALVIMIAIVFYQRVTENAVAAAVFY